MRKDVSSSRVESDPHSLASEVIDLREELRVLRDVIDELREEFTYAARNGRIEFRVATALPLEPAQCPDEPPEPGKQQRLF